MLKVFAGLVAATEDGFHGIGAGVTQAAGRLSAAKTSLQTILIELRTLAENAIDATALRESFGAPADAA